MGPVADLEYRMDEETEDPSLKLGDEDVVSTGQRPYRRVGKPRRYEDGNFETQFRSKERARKRKETEVTSSDASRQQQEQPVNRSQNRSDIRCFGSPSVPNNRRTRSKSTCREFPVLSASGNRK